MSNYYFYPKMKYTKNEVSFMYIFFENGDFLEIKGSEIVNFSISVYDKLIRSHEGYNPVVESGYCKKSNDGSIIIAFGKNSKDIILKNKDKNI